MQLRELVDYLDGFLAHQQFRDIALNGLQVDGGAPVERIALAVDSSLGAIEQAIAGGAQLLLVHHGLFWGALEPITGMLGRRVRTALKADLSIYASHLPLDAHPEVGNNAELARLLGAEIRAPLGEFKGAKVGFAAEFAEPPGLDALRGRIARALKLSLAEVRVFGAAERPIKRLGIVSGGASSNLQEAIDAGCDAFLTGEPHYSAFHVAVEQGVPLICAGHYHTETLGVKALAAHLHRRFVLSSFFIDLPTGI